MHSARKVPTGPVTKGTRSVTILCLHNQVVPQVWELTQHQNILALTWTRRFTRQIINARVDQLEAKELFGPAVVIDVAAICKADADYVLTAADVTAWEKDHGQIPKGCIVIMS